MACKYVYQGQTFSRVEILTMIRDKEINAPLDQDRARQWLNEKLSLTDDNVKIVKGLLDTGAYGKFLSDGNLLLSDQLEGVQYHEAFHRVFRMLLTDQERQSIIDEFMKRSEAKSLLASIAKRYPNESQATRVEEAIAEEFMYYSLNNGNYPVEQVVKTLFEKIIDFINRLLGINKSIPIRELYEAIHAGKYRSVQPVSYAVESANMLLLDDGIAMTVEQKNEMMGFTFMEIMKELSDSELLYEFINGELPKDTFHTLFVQSVIDMLTPVDIVDGENKGGYGLIDTDEVLAAALIKDMFGDAEAINYASNVLSTSKVFAAFREYAGQFSLKLGTLDGDNTVKTTEELDDVSNEEDQVGDNAFMKVSFEYDPRGNLNKAVKLMMASVPDINSDGAAFSSATLGLPKAISYNEITKIVYNELAGIPASYEHVIAKLRSAAIEHPSLTYIIERLEADTESAMRLRTEFIAGMAKNKYTFQKSVISNGEHRFVNISDASQGGKYVQLWKNRLETGRYDVGHFTMQLIGTRDISALATLLGFDEINELGLLETVFDEDTGQTVAERISIIAGFAADALNRGVNINDLYDYRKNDDDISSSVRLLGEFVASKGIPFDMLLLNSERKRIFAISEHTYQTIIEGHLNSIADQVRGIADVQQRRKAALERIKKELPHLLHIENFDGTNVRSRFLKDVLNGDRIGLFVMDGVDAYSSTETHFSKIGYTDYISQYVNSVLHGKLLGFKHGDRKVIYGYDLNEPFVNQMDNDAIINDAVSLASEYLFDEVRRIRAIEQNPGLVEGFANIENAKNFQHFDMINYDVIKKAKSGAEVEALVGKDLKKFFRAQSEKLLKEITAAGLLARPEFGMITDEKGNRKRVKNAGKVVGIDNVIYEKFKAVNGDNVDNAIASYVSSNYFFGFIEQMRVFNGEPFNYKSFVDFYKRAQMQSSTGTVMMYGETVEEYIERLNAEDSFMLDGVERTYGVNDLKRRGYMSEIVTYEQKFDSSAAVDRLFESVIDGEMVSLVQFLNERGVMMETGDPVFARKQALRNVEAMRGYDENDGQSWINMFTWREYMIKAGKWSPQKQNTFQIELAALQADNISDTIVYVDATFKDKFYAKERPNTIAVKIFDVADVKEKLDPKKGAESFMIRHTDYATVLKPQYTGPFTPNDPLRSQEEHLNVMAGRKTAYMVMLPTTVHGTKLEMLNRMMLRKGLDANHTNSSAKFGRRSKVEGMEIYDADGNFNEGLEELADSQVSYLEFRYMKDQVNVSTKAKQEIKNATQSMKTMLQNMFNSGVPVDYGNDTVTKTKEGVDFVFEQNPELAKIGTPEQYSAYLDTIFPDSKVNDIVYHSTPHYGFDNFSRKNLGTSDRAGIAGFDFLKSKAATERYLKGEFIKGNNSGTYAVLINATSLASYQDNTLTKETAISIIDKMLSNKTISEDTYSKIQEGYINSKYQPTLALGTLLNKIFSAERKKSINDGETAIKDFINVTKIDSFYQGKTPLEQAGTKISVFEPEQIHILGSTKDIERFKKFTANRPAKKGSAYSYNPSNVSEQVRNEYERYVIDTLGYPLYVEYMEEGGDTFYQFEFADQTIIKTSAKGTMLSIPVVTDSLLALSKKDPGYDIKYLIGLNKIAEGETREHNQSNWKLLTEEQKLEASPIYQIYAEYRDNLYNYVRSAATELERELGEGNRIVTVLRKAAYDRQEAKYILDSIEAFNDNNNIDTIPNGNRVENIMYSLVTKGAISLFRPGNGVPQVSTSLWESPDTQRITKEGRVVSENQAASFYGLRADGGLTPAKAIMPLEPKMINMFLKKFNTTNIMEALERYRELPDSEKFIFKSLRIPNQQFSFNDVFIIDRFTSPLTQSFVVVPSEIVPKTDADFDLDKQQLYGFARDANGDVLQPVQGTTDEDALLRMRQWKTLSKLFLDDARDVLYNDSITYGELEETLLSDLKQLKKINKELKKRNNVKDRDSDLNRMLAEDLADIGDEYGIAGISIVDLLDDISSQLDTIVDSGVFQPLRFKELLDAKAEIFDLFSEEREERNANVENRAMIYDALADINKQIEEIELVDFIDKYEDVDAQTHPLVKHNMLLQSEIELLLHPSNAHKMVSSADDSYLSKQQFQRVMSRLEGVSEQTVADNQERYTLGDMNSAEFLSVGGNAKRAVQMIGSKANVGPVAKSITNHNVGQADNAILKPTFIIVEKGQKVEVSSKLPIIGKDNDYSMAHMLTDDQQYILDLFSALLTAQVDGVNNPYAPRMNLSEVTLPPVLMLMRRGLNFPTILNIINNPLVRQYINAQNINDSFVYSASGYSKQLGVKKGNVRMLESFLKDRKVNPSKFNGIRQAYRMGKGMSLDPSQLEDRLGKLTVTDLDLQVLAAYLLIQEQARSLLTTVKDLGPDTTPKKDRADIVEDTKNYNKLVTRGITDTSHRRGFLKPFYENQQLYVTLFDKYYQLPHEQLDEIAENLGTALSADDFRKMRSKLSEDFMVFLMQNFVEPISRYSAEELLQGDDSFIHELSVMKSDNYAFKMLLPILNIGTNPVTGNAIHNVKIVDQGVTTVSINDMYEEFQMLDDMTQEKLIATSIYQSGISNSPFSLRTILDVGMVNEAMQEATSYVRDYAMVDIDQKNWQTFINLFMRNNPQFLPRNEYAAKNAGLKVYTERESSKGFFTIKRVEGGSVIAVRGSVSPAVLNYKITAFDANVTESNTALPDGENFTDKPVETPVITDQDVC